MLCSSRLEEFFGEFVDQFSIDNFQFLASGFFVMVPHGSPIKIE